MYFNNKEIENYFWGFVHSDGTMREDTRNRGQLGIEINIRDEHILKTFQSSISVNSQLSNRSRTTNFSNGKESTTSIFSIHDWGFRNYALENGMFYGRKSEKIAVLDKFKNNMDYWRGFVDGDGSLGLIGSGVPFLSLCTQSENIARAFVQEFQMEHKILNRNKRDGVYNIVVKNEDAQRIVSKLYYKGCTALNRKLASAKLVLDWQRTKTKVFCKSWSEQDLDILRSHSATQAAILLCRTESSVKNKMFRLGLSNSGPKLLPCRQ